MDITESNWGGRIGPPTKPRDVYEAGPFLKKERKKKRYSIFRTKVLPLLPLDAVHVESDLSEDLALYNEVYQLGLLAAKYPGNNVMAVNSCLARQQVVGDVSVMSFQAGFAVIVMKSWGLL